MEFSEWYKGKTAWDTSPESIWNAAIAAERDKRAKIGENMDYELAIECAEESKQGGYDSQSAQALQLLADNSKAAVQGLKGVDDLLAEAGFSIDSSVRNQLACVKSMLMG